jgi:hypothetical protein
MKVSFDTTHLVRSNKSLLKELEDDFGAVPQENSSLDFEVYEEEEKSNMDNVTHKKIGKSSVVEHSDHNISGHNSDDGGARK